MKRLAVALFTIVICSPLHAQTGGGTAGGSSTPGATGGTGGGGGIGTGAGIGTGGALAGTGSFGPTIVLGNQAANPQVNTNVVPTSANPYKTTYNNPQAFGLSASFSTTGGVAKPAAKSFGQSLFGANKVAATAAVLGILNNTGGASLSTSGYHKVLPYGTVLADDIPFIAHPLPEMQLRLQGVIDRSSRLKSKDIRVEVVDGRIVLIGQVPTDRERALAEAIVRLTPGATDVENLLEVR